MGELNSSPRRQTEVLWLYHGVIMIVLKVNINKWSTSVSLPEITIEKVMNLKSQH